MIVNTASDAPVEIKMIDIMGKTYYHNSFSRHEVSRGTRITPPSTLLNGMYVLIVNQGKYTVKEKVMIKN
jgi:hypothetical protein